MLTEISAALTAIFSDLGDIAPESIESEVTACGGGADSRWALDAHKVWQQT
jgi:hypothetical protein